MIGFNCRSGDNAVSTDRIEAMLKSIGVKDYKVP